MYALIPVGIALYIFYPLLAGDYLYPISEYEIYKSFMVNFIETLRNGNLPVWNEYVGSGHPALYFGHYPITQNTIVYMLFGFSDFTYYFTKFLNLTILFLSFIYACRYLRFSYLIALIGALAYFSVNFTTRFLIEDTIGNLVLVYPLLMIFIVKIIDENKKKDILIFSLFYIFWLTGGHIVFELMYLLMLSLFYLITVFVFYKTDAFRWVNLKRFIPLYFVLFIIPFLAVLYQYYFIYDVISASNRLKEGLIVSPFESAVWRQLAVSFQSSSYFWVGLSLILIYAGFKLLTVRYGFIETRKIKLPSLLLLFILPVLFYALKEKPNILKIFGLKDYIIAASGHKDNYMLLKIDKDNLVLNGGFENGANGWTAQSAMIESFSDGKSGNALKITTDKDDAGYVYVAIPTNVGENYKVMAHYKDGSSTLGQIKVGTSIDDTTLYYSGVISDKNWRMYEGIFEANTSTTYLTLVNPVQSRGTSALFDNVVVYRLTPTFAADYIPILKSNVFMITLLLYFSMHLIFNRMNPYLFISLKNIFIFIIYISLLSHYLYSPSNINGYNYDLFKELSAPFQIILLLSILFSLKDYQTNSIIRTVVWSSIALYLIRSHLAIPLLRFGGILWSTAKDGAIFSFFFAVLFMFGFKNILFNLSNLLKGQGRASKYIQYILLASVLILFVRDSFNKFYKGTANRYIYPNKRELANTPGEKWIIDAREEIVSLNNKLLALDKEVKHFYRVFTPENSYVYLAGNLQQHKLHEAAIYESSVSREFKEFYNYTILQKRPSDTENLKDIIPGSSFTRHVHAGLNLHYREISYGRDIFMFDPRFDDAEYLRNENIEFLWDIMQVKYLIIGPEFSKVLEGFSDRNQYKLLGNYPKLNFNLYEITKDKSYSKLAVLPLEDGQEYETIIQQLNSKDIDILKDLYSKMVFLDRKPPDFNLLKSQNDNNKRYYEIYAKQKAILIDFESWNHNWELEINNKEEGLQQAFQIFKGMKIEPGLNKIELTYNLKYFKGLFFLSILVVLIYIIFLIRCYYLERGNNSIIKSDIFL